MEAIKKIPDECYWDDAYDKVEHYLLALKIKNRRVLSKLVYLILDKAAKRLANEPHKNQTTVAMEEAHRITAEWLDRVLGKKNTSNKISVRGRLAMLLADVPDKWLEYFLEDGPWPEEFLKEMQEAYVYAGPDFQKARMLPRALKFTSTGSIIAETFKFLGKRPHLKWLVYWFIIAILFILLFYSTR